MKSKKTPVQLYCSQMEEIKARVAVVDYLFFSGKHALTAQVAIEFGCLQFRKILELIAFASLIANKEIYAAQHKKFESHWNAELLLKDLERLNKDFYPFPMIEEPSSEPGVRVNQRPRTNGFLTKAEFIDVYKKCGGMMHARNPYGSKIGMQFYENAIPEWREKIIGLLNAHAMKVYGDPGFWLIHMQEDGVDAVKAYTFAPVAKKTRP